jgi:hypothetical protein
VYFVFAAAAHATINEAAGGAMFLPLRKIEHVAPDLSARIKD